MAPHHNVRASRERWQSPACFLSNVLCSIQRRLYMLPKTALARSAATCRKASVLEIQARWVNGRRDRICDRSREL